MARPRKEITLVHLSSRVKPQVRAALELHAAELGVPVGEVVERLARRAGLLETVVRLDEGVLDLGIRVPETGGDEPYWRIPGMISTFTRDGHPIEVPETRGGQAEMSEQPETPGQGQSHELSRAEALRRIADGLDLDQGFRDTILGVVYPPDCEHELGPGMEGLCPICDERLDDPM